MKQNGTEMRRKVFLTIALFILASQGYVANGQFTPAEIAQRQEIEEMVKEQGEDKVLY